MKFEKFNIILYIQYIFCASSTECHRPRDVVTVEIAGWYN